MFITKLRMQLMCVFYSNYSFNKPHDYIITLDEGEIGLPDKYFYNRDQNDEVNIDYIL